MDRVTKLLMLWQNIATYEGKLQECEKERQKIYEAQRQIQGNMEPWHRPGKREPCAHATWNSWRARKNNSKPWLSKRPT